METELASLIQQVGTAPQVLCLGWDQPPTQVFQWRIGLYYSMGAEFLVG